LLSFVMLSRARRKVAWPCFSAGFGGSLRKFVLQSKRLKTEFSYRMDYTMKAITAIYSPSK